MELLKNTEFPPDKREGNHILSIMRLTFLFLLIGMFTIHAEVSSHVYSISVKNAKLRDVLRNIEERSGLSRIHTGDRQF